MPTLHPRIKLEFFLEHRLLGRLLALFKSHGVRGWTVMAAEQGQGGHGPWYGGEPTGVSEHAVVVTVVREEVAEHLLEAVAPELEPLGMVVLKSQVDVLRGDRF